MSLAKDKQGWVTAAELGLVWRRGAGQKGVRGRVQAGNGETQAPYRLRRTVGASRERLCRCVVGSLVEGMHRSQEIGCAVLMVEDAVDASLTRSGMDHATWVRVDTEYMRSVLDALVEVAAETAVARVLWTAANRAESRLGRQEQPGGAVGGWG